MIPGLITSWSKTRRYSTTRLVGMDIVANDEWIALNKRGALWGHNQVIYLLVLHV
jgi:hypothetical protein